MTLKRLLAFALLFTSSASSFGFTVTPALRASGQVLVVACDPKMESTCTSLCNQAASCEIKESYCRDCAGTQNLKLKRILDAVGTSVIAVGDAEPDSYLSQILKAGSFISLNPMTIYNYSGVYDGDQAQAQFRYLCPNLSFLSAQTGILIIGLDENNTTMGVRGAICPDDKTGQASFYKTNSGWQLP